MPGKTYHPLETGGDDNEYSRFREAAKSGDVKDEVIGLTLIDTGIRRQAMAHLRGDHVKLHSQNPQITIPQSAPCTLGIGPTGSGGDTSAKNRNQPCSDCVSRPVKDWAPVPDGVTGTDAEEHNFFTPKTQNAHRPVPIKNDDTLTALDNYFRIYDKMVTANTISRRVKQIGERADIDREVSPHDLRDTFGTKIASDGFKPHEIKDAMGHANLRESIQYVKLSGRNLHDAFNEKWT